MSLSRRARISLGPDTMFPAYEFVGSLSVAWWRAILLRERVGLQIKELVCIDAESASMHILRAPLRCVWKWSGVQPGSLLSSVLTTSRHLVGGAPDRKKSVDLFPNTWN